MRKFFRALRTQRRYFSTTSNVLIMYQCRFREIRNETYPHRRRGHSIRLQKLGLVSKQWWHRIFLSSASCYYTIPVKTKQWMNTGTRFGQLGSLWATIVTHLAQRRRAWSQPRSQGLFDSRLESNPIDRHFHWMKQMEENRWGRSNFSNRY